ncbi:hypothetical protein ACFQUU_23160 [Herbaspirillum sp. GCM10030257]|uniref:hypothetical protein n=1 Tax=Herbaspirillum sp. GCM10030257 TaxID=3273393 RepID=UPI0036126A87
MKISVAVFCVGVLGACSTTPNYDAKFGDAVRQSRIQMTINPDAGKNLDSVAGMDGKSAKEAVGRYQGSFKEPPPVTNVINIGGSVGSGR